MMQVPTFSSILKEALERDENVRVLKSLNEIKSMETLKKEFGEYVKGNLDCLKNAGLIVTILRNNPSELQEYYKRTAFGEKILLRLD